MARKAKTPKFDVFNNLPNCFGIRQGHDGSWQTYFADPGRRLTIEVGCGRAELAFELAKLYPEQNFIGIDKKSDRMWFHGKHAIKQDVKNIAFIQTDSQRIFEYFEHNKADEIWITFPDPFPRDKHEKYRLVNKKFTELYKSILKPGGLIRFKTDDLVLFNFFIYEVLPDQKNLKINYQTNNLHAEDCNSDYKILTTYEKRWIEMGRLINFVELELVD